MSQKQKSGFVDQQTKKNKKAQKWAKQQQKQKQLSLKGQEKRQFKQLVGVRIVSSQELAEKRYVLIKNKKVQEYADQILSSFPNNYCLYGIEKNIAKTISVVEAIKHKMGVYNEINTKIQQQTQIVKDINNNAVILIRLRKI